ncbi:hypothetical protein [Siccirubricoccus phaeus]|uniref:hypothetical protein n=1 Tax=Siccirubricoccus phaeus TaxID=2595053 RepID=UPI00165C764A|nr:hypothetical protein [Siccirubricoccus phaeus]
MGYRISVNTGGTFTDIVVLDLDGQLHISRALQALLLPGQVLRGQDSAGGGHGDPLSRGPARVLHDVLAGWESRQKAFGLHGVAFTGTVEDDSLAVDQPAMEARRCGRGGQHE